MRTTIPKLPLWATVKASYSLSWKYRMEYLRISHVWIIILLPLIYLYNYVTWPFFQPTNCQPFLPSDVNMTSAMALANSSVINYAAFGISPYIVEALIYASIAIAWHRFILRNEKIQTDRYLRFDKVVINYFVWDSLFTFSVCLPIALWFFKSPGLMGISFIIMIVLSFFIPRFFVFLPAIALGTKDVTFKIFCQKTRWSNWRFFIGSLLTAIPYCLFSLIRSTCQGSVATNAMLETVQVLLITLVAIPIATTFLALCYRHFFEYTPAESTEASNT